MFVYLFIFLLRLPHNLTWSADHDAVQQALKMHSDKTLRSHGEDEEEEAEDSGVGSSMTRNAIAESSETMNRSTISSGSDISLSSVLSQAGSSPRHPDLGPNRMTKSASKTLT